MVIRNKFNRDVLEELTAMAEIGMSVPDKAFDLALGDLSEYENMTITACADLLCDLGRI